MELTLIEENKTQIKVSCKELRSILGNLKPCKESTRYKYYVVEGDFPNGKR